MDGNRRYARQLGQHALMGHAKGASTASKVLEWWIKYLPNTTRYASPVRPKYLTCWAFSSENFERPEDERDGLFAMMAAEFKSLAFTSLIHLFQIRIRFIGGERNRFPPELLETMDMVEKTTSAYGGLFLQIAVGYGGRQEVVSAVRGLVTRGQEITEQSIGAETYCAQLAVPPVNLIIRTSERRLVLMRFALLRSVLTPSTGQADFSCGIRRPQSCISLISFGPSSLRGTGCMHWKVSPPVRYGEADRLYFVNPSRDERSLT
jgi:undecaprenyl diphosphate synthase